MPFETLLQDLRIGFRVLVKERAFAGLAILVLALGISAVTTQFAVVNGVLIRGPAFPRAAELVDLQLADPTNFSPGNFNARITTRDFVELKAQQQSYSAFVAYLNGSTVNLTANGTPQRLQGGYVTWDFFRALGVAPALGRDFLAEEDRPGVAKAVILSDAIWHRDFGGDPAAIGRAVRVNGTAGTIIGVMPPKFAFPANEQVWIPVNTAFPPKERNDPNIQTVNVIARLKPGVSLDQANLEIAALAKRFAADFPENKQFSFGFARPLVQSFTGGNTTGMLYTMLAFCVGVLLIACFNVMNLQLARATLRARELAIRSSLGASRLRLLRQMLTESLLLAGIGALLGVGLALWATDWINATFQHSPNPPPAWMQFDLDRTVLAAVVAVTLLTAALSGLLPAWMASRTHAIDVLKESGRGHTGAFVNFVMRALVVFQILATAILLLGALLITQSIVHQQHLDYGYDTTAVLSARMGLMEGDYPTNESRVLFLEKLRRELRTVPAFTATALTNRFQMVFTGSGPIEIEGRDYKTNADRPVANFENITDGYFATLDQRLLSGRDFTMDDNDLRQPVAIVNADFARKHFGNESPIGRRFRAVSNDGTIFDPWRTIVGVAATVRMTGPYANRTDSGGYYVPLTAQVYGNGRPAINGFQFCTLLVRGPAATRPESLDAALRRTVARIDPNLPLYFVATPAANLADQVSQMRIIGVMFSLFGLIAIILAAAGLYAVISFAVNQRTQEFGIRMALGAAPRALLGMVFKQGAWQLGLGLALGFALALAIATLAYDALAGFLVGISPCDPLTYVAVAALLGLVAFLATLFPARRATRVDPMIALRAE